MMSSSAVVAPTSVSIVVCCTVDDPSALKLSRYLSFCGEELKTRMSERHCELSPTRCPTAGKINDSAVGAFGSIGTTGVTRLIVSGADLLVPPFAAIFPIDEVVVTITVAVKVPLGSSAGSIVTFSVIPSGGRRPLEGSILTIQGRSAVAVNETGALSPGMKTCCTTRSLLPDGTFTVGALRLIVVGTMTTRMTFEYGPGVFVQALKARTRSKNTCGPPVV